MAHDDTGGAYAVVAGYGGDDAELALPGQFEGLRVRAIAARAFEAMSGLRAVRMPDSVEEVGAHAFSRCRDLEALFFSDAISQLDSTVLSGCRSLAEVHLPAALKVLPARLLSDCQVKCLRLERGLEQVASGALACPMLRRIEVAGDNAHFSTDGVALFDERDKTLLMAPIALDHYVVPPGCTGIAPSAFKGMTSLVSIELPDSLESIGAYALFRTSIAELVCPPSLREIGARACASCAMLERVSFNDALESIGEAAFERTSLSRALLPASLSDLGQGAFARSGIDFEMPGDFVIDRRNPTLFYDGQVLYRVDEEGLRALELLAPCSEICELAAQTVEIADGAFEGARQLHEVAFGDKLRRIGKRAFCGCASLSQAQLPASLEHMGDEAFFGTALSEASIGPALDDIGDCALEVAGDVRTGERHVLEHVDVDSGNSRFYVSDRLLLERVDGIVRTRLFMGPADVVHIPAEVSEIAEMTFYRGRARELYVPGCVTSVAKRAFLGFDGFENVHIEFPYEVDGVREVTVLCPGLARDPWDFSRVLAIDDDGLFFDFASYDQLAVHELDHARVVEMALARLLCPVKLSASARANYQSAVGRLLPEALASYAQADNLEAFELVGHAGLLEGDVLELARKVVTQMQAPLSSAYLERL